MIRRFLIAMAVVLPCLVFLNPVHAQTGGSAGEGSLVRISDLQNPMSLVGNWLFTREDEPHNKDVEVDTSQWKVIKAPGSWKGIYEDSKPFTVGWYRTTLEFNKDLIGKEVVLLVDPLQARLTAYIDGQETFRRPGNVNVDRYFMWQPIPIRFTVTQQHHVIALRIESQIMVGIAQLPLEVDAYRPQDKRLSWFAVKGGELRLLAGFISIFFGFFFVLVYSKTRASLYGLVAASSVLLGYFFSFQSDVWVRIFEPESILYWSNFGLVGLYTSWLLTQQFHKIRPLKLNIAVGLASGMFILAYVLSGSVFHNFGIAIKLRGVILATLLLFPVASSYQLFQGARAKKPGALYLCIGMFVFLITAGHDAALASGLIVSTQVAWAGMMTWMASMLYVTSNIFANTFQENRQLVGDLKVINDNLEGMVSERTQQLREKSNDIQAMLQNMPQGILTIVNGDTIHPEYSAYLEQIFETKEIAGQKVADLVLANSSLGSDVLDQVNAAIAACIGEDSMNFEFNSHLLVSELDKTMPSGAVKSLELIWSPICNDQDVVDKLMLCVRDVTELKKLAKEAGQQKRELEIIGQILAVNQEKFHEFVDSSGKFISENQHIIRQAGSGGEDKTAETLTLLFRNMHTIKGNARTYGLLHLTNLVHEAEQTYDELRKNPDAQWDAEQLLKQLEEAHTAIAEYARINEVKLGRKGPGRRGSVEKFLMVEKEQVQKALDLLDHVDQSNPAAMSDAVAKVRMTLMLIGTDRMESILSGVTDSLPSLAKELGKEAPDVVINDHGIVIKTQVADLVKNVFMHLYRNSMDHGLETAQVRLAKGKPAQGRIGLNLHLESDQIQMQLQDDGKGLAVGYILKKALEKGLVKEGEHPTPEQIAQFIFAAGFSTADKVTEVSGRGVGMDAVKGFVERESGSIELKFVTDSDAGEDFRHFVTLITLPAKFAVQGPV